MFLFCSSNLFSLFRKSESRGDEKKVEIRESMDN